MDAGRGEGVFSVLPEHSARHQQITFGPVHMHGGSHLAMEQKDFAAMKDIGRQTLQEVKGNGPASTPLPTETGVP